MYPAGCLARTRTFTHTAQQNSLGLPTPCSPFVYIDIDIDIVMHQTYHLPPTLSQTHHTSSLPSPPLIPHRAFSLHPSSSPLLTWKAHKNTHPHPSSQDQTTHKYIVIHTSIIHLYNRVTPQPLRLQVTHSAAAFTVPPRSNVVRRLRLRWAW